jgi:DNA-binding NtrC family response regulator
MPQPQILIVDDDANARRLLSYVLTDAGYRTQTVTNGYEADSITQNQLFDLVLLDKKMLGLDGIETLKRIKRNNKETTVIIMTAYGTIRSVVEAMKEGAYDYITKPFDMDELVATVRAALSEKAASATPQVFSDEYCFEGIVGKSSTMRTIFQLIEKAAATDSTVLIQGETGTGKELVARAIHQRSPRSKKPFVLVSCAALPENLLESELFGHVKGAFTSAIKDRVGRIEQAEGGTVLLDEIGEISPAIQVKLLRLLQSKEYEKVGSSQTRKADIRVIAATNKNLKGEIEAGNFREDLFYRLNVIPIDVPPLRERVEDIPHMAYHFFKINGAHNKHISKDAMRVLQDYNWPGNVRELKNLIERFVSLSNNDELQIDDLPGEIKKFRKGQKSDEPEETLTLKEVERRLILKALERSGGNQTKAAQALGISRSTLINKLKEYAEETGEVKRET